MTAAADGIVQLVPCNDEGRKLLRVHHVNDFHTSYYHVRRSS